MAVSVLADVAALVTHALAAIGLAVVVLIVAAGWSRRRQ